MENQSDSSQNQQSELSLGALKPIIPSGMAGLMVPQSDSMN